MVERVKEIKLLIDKVMLPNYSYKTDFSCPEFLIDINDKLIISAQAKVKEDKVVYEYGLNTEFLRNKYITSDEIEMIKNIIDILEDNHKFVISKFKKYTVKEFLDEEERRHEQSEMMFESLKEFVENAINKGR